MLSVESLKGIGVDPAEGLSRCMDNEAFYLRLVRMGLEDAAFDRLSAAVAAGDKAAAFDAAHALKGVLSNLALTPLAELASEMTELLRAGQDADYPAYLDRLLTLRDQILSL